VVDAASLGIGVTLLLIGLALLAFEIAHPGIFLVIPATVFIAAGVLYLLFGPAAFVVAWGPGAVIIAAVLAAFATIPWYRRLAPIHRPMSTTTQSLEGEVGTVIAPVVPNTLQGKVRIRSEVWSARATREIPVGTQVKVIGGEGVSIWVEPLAPAAAESVPKGGASSWQSSP
jgi:membrane protein implicated in regulation of membrane protease activity